jgi:hypothetical protein
MTTPKFTDFVHPHNTAFQYDAETLALHRAYSGYQFQLVNAAAARITVDALITLFRAQPTPPSAQLHETYKRAKAIQPVSPGFEDIVADWEHYESRFLSLLKANNVSSNDIDLYATVAHNTLLEVKILCCYIKVECDAARPWQYPSPVQGITSKDIIDRWNAQIHNNSETLCTLPLHASYPAGHSCIAYMHAALIAREFGRPLGVAADEIAVNISNRRIDAGVHFERDIDAAKALIRAAIS